MRSIEEDGVWFLPNNPNKEISGRLTFSAEEDPKLYLIDQLREIKFDDTTPPRLEFDIVNGYLVNGKKVTLCNCYQPVGFKTGIQTSTIYAKYLIIGHHFKTLEEILLKGVSLRYKNLEDWVDLSNFEIQFSTNDERNQVKEIKVKQITQEPFELGRLADFSLMLYDKPIELERLTIAGFFGIGRKVSLEERKSIIIQADHKKKLEDIINVIYLFQDLLIFAFGQMTYPYDIQSGIVVIEKKVRIPDYLNDVLMTGLIKPQSEEIKIIEEEKEELVPIEIYFQVAEREDLDVKFNFQKVLFSFKDVKDQFSELLSLWEQNSKELDPIIDLYLRLTYIPKRHINDFFLSLAQAIEAFHSLTHSGKYIDKNVHKKVVRKILEEAVDSIPDSIPQGNGEENLNLINYKKILKKEKFSHLNSFSLRERLEEIIHEYHSCLPDSFFASLEEQSDFLKKVRKTRNYLTHLSSKEDKYVVFGQDLIDLSRKLKVLLEVCLLKKLGLKDMDIKTIIAAKNS
jgi:hypothetical protein